MTELVNYNARKNAKFKQTKAVKIPTKKTW